MSRAKPKMPDDFPLGKEQYWGQYKKYYPLPERGKIVAVMNKKGGCGKTKTAIAIGTYLAEMGAKVLFWDMDEQNSLGRRLDYTNSYDDTFSSYLGAQKSSKVRLVHPGWIYGRGIEYALIPAGNGLLSAVSGKIDRETLAGRDRANWWKELVNDKAQYFDYIIFDTGPSRNELHKLVTMVAEEIVIPFDGIEALEGACDLLPELELEGPSKKNGVLVMVKYQKDGRAFELSKHRIYQTATRIFPDSILQCGVREHPGLKKDYDILPGYADFDPRKEYKAVVSELIQFWDNGRPYLWDVFNTDNSRKLISELKQEDKRNRAQYKYDAKFIKVVVNDDS